MNNFLRRVTWAVLIGLAILTGLVLAGTAHAQESNNDYWMHERHRVAPVHKTPNGVQGMIAVHVARAIGARWVPTALRIAKIESGFRCSAYNHGAIGIFQVRHPQRFGVSAASAQTCEGGIIAGVAHMRRCVALGAQTERQMFTCHNAGSPFSRHVERAYRRILRG